MDENCILGSPTSICLTDSLVVIVDTKSDSIFHFIDRSTGRHRGDYGRKGQAPGEYLLVSCVIPYRHDTVCFYDVNKHELSFMRMSPSWQVPMVWKSFREYGLNAFLGNSVLVYDWDGRLLKERVLDLPANLLCVDDEDEYLYAIVADGEYRLVRYEL